jgi:hypothetical protein
MANEFGEDPSYYIWPTGHEDGEPFPEDFDQRLNKALRAAGFECEPV